MKRTTVDTVGTVQIGHSAVVPVSEARAQLSALIKQVADGEVTLINHGRPAAVLMSAGRYDALLEELEDLKDRLSVYERDGVTVSLDNLVAELGIADDLGGPAAAQAELDAEQKLLRTIFGTPDDTRTHS